MKIWRQGGADKRHERGAGEGPNEHHHRHGRYRQALAGRQEARHDIGYDRRKPDAQSRAHQARNGGFREYQRDDAIVGKAHGLEGGEFGETLAHRLRKAVGGEEQHHEHAGQGDVAIDGGNVHPCAGRDIECNFFGDGLDRCGRAGKAIVDPLGDFSGLAGIADLDADLGGLALVRQDTPLVHIVGIAEQVALAHILDVRCHRHDLEFPAGSAVYLLDARHDHSEIVSGLEMPAVGLHLAHQQALAIVTDQLPLLRGDRPFVHHLGDIFVHHLDKNAIPGVLGVAAHEVGGGDHRDAGHAFDLALDRYGQAAAETGKGKNAVVARFFLHLGESGVHADGKTEQCESQHHRQQSEDGAGGLAHDRGPDQGKVFHAVAMARSISWPLSISN